MRLTSLDLENIKSYSRQRIDLTCGLNAVCGLNGSGKTTVLEAIGFALFDYLPYSQSAFIREGQKSGAIRVRLETEDGQEYEVVRKIGTGASHYVADVATGTRLAERGTNVLDWMRTRALGIDAETDLEALFKNAVGVPQGTMTADFLATATTRKAIFDPLLRVEEYRNAFLELKDTVSYVRNQAEIVNVEIDHLQRDVDCIPEKVDEVRSLQTQIESSQLRLDSIVAELGTLEAQKRVLDEIEQQLIGLRQDLQRAEYNVSRYGDILADRQQKLDSARSARQAVVESEPGYHLVRAAREELAVLDKQRSLRDGLRAAQAKVKGEIDGTRRQIDRLQADLKVAAESAIEAERLNGSVARQEELDRQVRDTGAQLQTARLLDDQISPLTRDIAELQRLQAERESRMEDAKSALPEAARLPAVQEERAAVQSRLGEMASTRKQLAGLEADGKRLRLQHDALVERTRPRPELQSELDRLLPVAETLDGLRLSLQDARDNRVRVAAAIDYQSVARAALLQHQCPLLELTCPVVSADDSALVRFDDRSSSFEREAERLGVQIAEIDSAVAAAQEAATRVQDVRLQLVQIDGDAARLEQVKADLERCRSQYRDLTESLKREVDLAGRLSELQREDERLQTAVRLAAGLPELETQYERDIRRLVESRARLAELERQRQRLREIEQRVRALQEELSMLNDPRARQQKLLSNAGRRMELERHLKREEDRLASEQARFDDFSERLRQFDDLDDQIDRQHAIARDHLPAYECYLQNRSEAEALHMRERDVSEAAALLESAATEEHAVRQRLEQTAAQYRADDHEALKAACLELQKGFVAETGRREGLTADCVRAEKELSHLRRQEEKLREKRGELSELQRTAQALGFIRDTIKAAGPAVTETLLSNISQVANDIYAEIMDDHAVELRWDREYDVIVQRGAEERKFSQLSGGEQMSAALAVRLALLKEMSEMDFAFFDEPTQNMDADRRTNLADQISQVKGFEQLIVISHDDTFEHHTDNLIRLRKENEETLVETV